MEILERFERALFQYEIKVGRESSLNNNNNNRYCKYYLSRRRGKINIIKGIIPTYVCVVIKQLHLLSNIGI